MVLIIVPPRRGRKKPALSIRAAWHVKGRQRRVRRRRHRQNTVGTVAKDCLARCPAMTSVAWGCQVPFARCCQRLPGTVVSTPGLARRGQKKPKFLPKVVCTRRLDSQSAQSVAF